MKKNLWIVVALLSAALLGSTIAWFYIARTGTPETAAPLAPKTIKTPIFEKIDHFLVNLDGDKNNRGVISVEIQVQLSDEKLRQIIQSYKPRIQNDLILLLGRQSLSDLSSPAGKQQLLNAVRACVNRSIGDSSGKNGVVGVVFTSLILEEK